MARNRVRSPPGHAFEPPRAIPFISEQLLNFRKISIFRAQPPSIFTLILTSIGRVRDFFLKKSLAFFRKIKKINVFF